MSEPYESTEAWKQARALTNMVYAHGRGEALARDFGLREQLRRAAVSVMNNVAAGWESLHPAGKRQAYSLTRRSCGEVRSMGYVLLDNRFISESQHAERTSQCGQAGKLISGLIRSLDDR